LIRGNGRPIFGYRSRFFDRDTDFPGGTASPVSVLRKISIPSESHSGTNPAAGSHFVMRSSKPGKIDRAPSVELRVIVSTALLALLLISQFPPVSGDITSRLAFEKDSALPGAKQAEKRNPRLVLAGILDEPVFQLPKIIRYAPVSGPRPDEVEVRASFTDIRAPPGFS